MLKVLGVVAVAMVFSTEGSVASSAARTARSTAVRVSAAGVDIASLLSSARGASPIICSLAAQSVRGWGWGGSNDAPVTPLPKVTDITNRDFESADLSAVDISLLLSSLSTDDDCVREMAVRLVARKNNPVIASGLIERLGAPQPALRAVAAFGLGLATQRESLDPLIRTLRDTDEGVRANAAWALGRLDNGRALQPLLGLVSDKAEIVRLASVAAIGRLDSVNAGATLIRVLREDQSPAVRRTAAWALGHLESRDAVQALSATLQRDSDARVREMSAWALGSIEARSASAALLAAARRDADEAVRETSAWALGRLEDAGVLDALSQVAATDRSARVRGTAAWSIGQLGDGEHRVPAPLLQLLRDGDDDARLKAAWAISQIGDSAAIPAVKAALKVERNETINKALTRALVRSGESSAAVFSELLDSKDPNVREAAVRGLAGRRSFNPWPWPWPRPRPFP
ncbi:MAG: HEAT repeat domain-containing protein [Gemmatimonadaceae bacterium]